ncbi:hypothetical protein MMC13_005773 [Lambiella insularis]|nr:hypothetical protein [Lambiella insularis]
MADAQIPASPQHQPAVSASKRSRESFDKSRTATPVSEPPRLDDRNDVSLPAFLRQTNAEILTRFEQLHWQQQNRIREGRFSKDPACQWAQYSTQETRIRNRYADIWPWANCRVHLKVPEGECDYINASPISICLSKAEKENRYIATQGPKEAGRDHFWQMIWHETKQPAVIVMLTQLSEGQREKCHQYYPEDTDSEGFPLYLTTATGEACAGSVKATESSFDEPSQTTIRKLLLTCGTATKTVWHLFFLGWPDFGVPEDRDRHALLALVKLSAAKNAGPDSPRIIHCSAGVGRSGTFIALEHLLAELDAGSLDDAPEAEDPIFNTVNALREQRMTMVQSDAQYQLLYDLLREQYLARQNAAAAATAAAVALNAAMAVNGAGLATEKLPPLGGEPSPKVMRLSRGIRHVFLRQGSRSSLRQADETAGEGKAPVTP